MEALPPIATEKRREVLKKLAILGDRASSLQQIQNQIIETSKQLADDAPSNLEYLEYGLMRCVVELAHKSSYYATLLALICTSEIQRTDILAERVITDCFNALHRFITDGDVRKGRRIVRFLSQLANVKVISVSSFVIFIETLITTADKEKEFERPALHARVVFLLELVLSGFPFVAATIYETMPDRLETMVIVLKRLHQDLSQHMNWSILSPFVITKQGVKLSQLRLDRDMVLLHRIEMQKWKCCKDPIIAPFTERISDIRSIELPQFAVPAHSKVSRYTPPAYIFDWLSDLPTMAAHEPDQSKSEDDDDHHEAGDSASPDNAIPTTALLDQYKTQEYLSDILENFVSDHAKGANFMEALVAIENGDIQPDIFNVVSNEALKLPFSQHSSLYYAMVVVNLCRTRSSQFPDLYIKAIDKIFDHTCLLDQEAFDRLTDLISIHLSNFGFQWNWQGWTYYAQENTDKFQRLFLSDIIWRCTRLYYRDWFVKNLPQELHHILPPVIEALPENKMTEELFGNTETRAQLLSIVTGKNKLPCDQVEMKLDHIMGDTSPVEKLRPLSAAILLAGVRTLSHFDTITERYLPLLGKLHAEGGIDADRVFVAQILEFWKNSPLRIAYMFDKIIRYKIVDPIAILREIFHNDDEIVALEKRMEVSCTWEWARLVFNRASTELRLAKVEVTTAARAASQATEAETEILADRIERAHAAVEKTTQNLKELVVFTFTRLFSIFNRLYTVAEMKKNSDASYNENLENGSIWEWRTLGFLKEIGRKNTDLIVTLLETLEKEHRLMEMIGDNDISLQVYEDIKLLVHSDIRSVE